MQSVIGILGALFIVIVITKIFMLIAEYIGRSLGITEFFKNLIELVVKLVKKIFINNKNLG